ncbi:MAG: hypothetical protein LAN63_05345 [Acidobacteriia bacterium]|nr:hypothetical protein [Terriglobia bacterium]
MSSLNKFLLVLVLGVTVLTTVPRATAQADVAHFNLFPNPKFASCLGVSGGATPAAKVTVYRGKLNDTLVISAKNIRPGLAFDMFTVQRTNLLPDATVDPAFTGSFGFAWYQSDLQANRDGKINATIKTVLLDQIFGFDPELSNPNPVNTFHLGFWFNDPNDANVNGCVFDVTHPTPFNGEHKAGPLAMISVPDADTNLGPLCTNPNTDTDPPSCNP